MSKFNSKDTTKIFQLSSKLRQKNFLNDTVFIPKFERIFPVENILIARLPSLGSQQWHNFKLDTKIIFDIHSLITDPFIRHLSVAWSGKCNNSYLTISAPTQQNGQIHSNNLPAICRRIVWVSLTILWDWHLKG